MIYFDAIHVTQTSIKRYEKKHNLLVFEKPKFSFTHVFNTNTLLDLPIGFWITWLQNENKMLIYNLNHVAHKVHDKLKSYQLSDSILKYCNIFYGRENAFDTTISNVK